MVTNLQATCQVKGAHGTLPEAETQFATDYLAVMNSGTPMHIAARPTAVFSVELCHCYIALPSMTRCRVLTGTYSTQSKPASVMAANMSSAKYSSAHGSVDFIRVASGKGIF